MERSNNISDNSTHAYILRALINPEGWEDAWYGGSDSGMPFQCERAFESKQAALEYAPKLAEECGLFVEEYDSVEIVTDYRANPQAAPDNGTVLEMKCGDDVIEVEIKKVRC